MFAIDFHQPLFCPFFSFFATFLQENGPLNVEDPRIQQEVDNFPPEAHGIISAAGGIGRFLIQSLQFAMIDDFVCLMHDAVKARTLADQYKQKLRETGSNSSGSTPGSPRTRGGKAMAQKPGLPVINIGSHSQFPSVAEALKRTDFDAMSKSSSDSTSRVASPASSLSGGPGLSLSSIAQSIPQTVANTTDTPSVQSLPAQDTSTSTSPSRPESIASPQSKPSVLPPSSQSVGAILSNPNLSSSSPSQVTNTSSQPNLTNFPSLHDANFDLPFGFTAQTSQESVTKSSIEDTGDLDESVVRDSLMVAKGVVEEAADDIREEFRTKVSKVASIDDDISDEPVPREEALNVYSSGADGVKPLKLPPGLTKQSLFESWKNTENTGEDDFSTKSTPSRPTQSESINVPQTNSLPNSPNRSVYTWSSGSKFDTWSNNTDSSPIKNVWSTWGNTGVGMAGGTGEFLEELSRQADKDESPPRDLADIPPSPSVGVIGSRPSSQTATPPVSDKSSPSPLPGFHQAPSDHNRQSPLASFLPPVADHNRQSPLAAGIQMPVSRHSQSPLTTFPSPGVDSDIMATPGSAKSNMLDDVDDDDSSPSSMSASISNPSSLSASINNSYRLTGMPTGSAPSPVSSLWGSALGIESIQANSQQTSWPSPQPTVEELKERVDDEFTKEMTASVFNDLMQHTAFQNDPSLLNNIMSVIQQDVAVSKNQRPENNNNMVDASVNTEEDIYKSKWENCQKELVSLSDRYQEMMDRSTKVQNAKSTEIQVLKANIEDMGEQNKVSSCA